jgi:hypothetical protein
VREGALGDCPDALHTISGREERRAAVLRRRKKENHLVVGYDSGLKVSTFEVVFDEMLTLITSKVLDYIKLQPRCEVQTL